jgi:hypothetical protein
MKTCVGFPLALGLLVAGTAAYADSCGTKGDVMRVLRSLDQTQIKFDETALMRVFADDAEIDAVSPAKTWKRTRAEFIEQHRSEAAENMLAYAFQDPAIDCSAEGKVNVVRRGCQVSRFSIGLMEISQTEEIEMQKGPQGLRITRMTSTLDAMRSSGKEVFKNRDFVYLPACTDAVAAKK